MVNLEVLSIRGMRGPNLWARVPLLDVCLRVCAADDIRSLLPTLLKDGVLAQLAAVPRSAEGVRLWDAWCAQQNDGICPAELLTQLTLILQTLTGPAVSFGRTLSGPAAGVVSKSMVEAFVKGLEKEGAQ